MKIIQIIGRWLLVILSAAAIALIVIQGTRWGVNLADTMCLDNNMIGGACVEGWHTGLVEAAVYLGVILCTLCLSIVPSALAPALRRSVSVIGSLGCFAGLCWFYFLTSWPELLLPMIISVLSGIAGVWWVWSKEKTNAVA